MERNLFTINQFIESRRDKYIARLKEFIAIKSISSDLDHRVDVIKALRWVALRLEKLGFKIRYRILGKENVYAGEEIPLEFQERFELPYVVTAEMGTDITRPNLLIYGHVDVKPITTQEYWSHDPFELHVFGDYLCGRGVTDDKGPVIGWINAIEAFIKLKIQLPVNLRILIEGMEECGSEGLPELLNEMRNDFLKAIDYVAISDNYWLGQQTPCVTYGLRGVIYFYMYVEGGTRVLHSGCHGGAVQEPLDDLNALLASLMDKNGNILIPDIYTYIRKLDEEELSRFEKLDFDACRYKGEIRTNSIYTSDKVKILLRRWCLPSISIHGVEDPNDMPGASTTIPIKVMGKFSIRIVPDQPPKVIANLVIKHLKEIHKNRKTGNKLTIKVFRDGQPFLADITCGNIKAAVCAVGRVWDKLPDLTRDGASIPMAVCLEEATRKDVVLIPMGQCLDHQHEENEKLSITNFINGIKVFANYFFQLAILDFVDEKEEKERQNKRMEWRKRFW